MKKIYAVVQGMSNDGELGKSLEMMLNEDWVVTRVDATQDSLVYILAKYEESGDSK